MSITSGGDVRLLPRLAPADKAPRSFVCVCVSARVCLCVCDAADVTDAAPCLIRHPLLLATSDLNQTLTPTRRELILRNKER